MISDELRARIRRLFYAEHWKVGTIAGELGLHRETVRHAIEVEKFVAHTRVVRPSMLDAYAPFLADVLAQYPRLTATRLYAMVHARGYQGSVVQLRRWVRCNRPAKAEAFLRLRTEPGEQAQVDWAHFGRVVVGRAVRALSCFVMVLSWSRAMYARFTYDQQLETFLRSHTLAFQAFGGVPRVLLYDNLKSVVLERIGDHIAFHPRLYECAAHHHFEPRPCAPYRGNEKGRVERVIRFLRESFFAARSFASLDDLNRQLAEWIAGVAHVRRQPGDKTLSVREALEQERPLLLPPPQHAFPCDIVRTVQSGKTPYLRFDLNDYSIPHTHVGRPLTLIANEQAVRVVDGTDEIARHIRSWSRGETIEDAAHIAALAKTKRHAHELRGRDRLRSACPSADPFIAALVERRVHLGSQSARLIKLLDLHGWERLQAALSLALQQGAISAESVAHLIDRARREQSLPPALEPILPDDARVRGAHVEPHPLAAYDALLRKDEP